jgi:hypothetical protein
MRGYRGGKDTTNDYRGMDVRWLHRRGLLKPGSDFTLRWSRNEVETGSVGGRATHDSIVLSYRHSRGGSDQWVSKEYPVQLAWTPCNYGGLRSWFLCPAPGCGRRVAVHYSVDIFACRHCCRLAYESQRDQIYEWALSRAQSIRMKLGGSGSMAVPFPDKPKGMHWRTYQRLRAEHDNANHISTMGMAIKLGMLQRRKS